MIGGIESPIGGRPTSQVDNMNATDGTIIATTYMHSPRMNASATTGDGYIVVFGGADGTVEYLSPGHATKYTELLSSCEVYDPLADRHVLLCFFCYQH